MIREEKRKKKRSRRKQNTKGKKNSDKRRTTRDRIGQRIKGMDVYEEDEEKDKNFDNAGRESEKEERDNSGRCRRELAEEKEATEDEKTVERDKKRRE